MLDEDVAEFFLQAAKSGDMETAERFLTRRGDLVNCTNDDRETPLHMAVQNGHYKMVQVLLAHGANPNAIDRQGVTPIQIAEQQGKNDLVRLLNARP